MPPKIMPWILLACISWPRNKISPHLNPCYFGSCHQSQSCILFLIGITMQLLREMLDSKHKGPGARIRLVLTSESLHLGKMLC
jgi:hypothetical protein